MVPALSTWGTFSEGRCSAGTRSRGRGWEHSLSGKGCGNVLGMGVGNVTDSISHVRRGRLTF